jgi:hypothetical protein
MKTGLVLWCVLFVVISLACLGLGMYSEAQKKTEMQTAAHATATLTEWIPDPNPKVADFCPVYEFTATNGIIVDMTGSDCKSKPDLSMIGSDRDVYYDPTNPQVVVGQNAFDQQAGIIGFVFFSLFWIVPVLAVVVRKFLKPAAASPSRDTEAELLAEMEKVEQLRKKLGKRG